MIANKWEVERNGLGEAVMGKTADALGKELRALKKREKSNEAIKKELEVMTKARGDAVESLKLVERELKSERASIRRMSAKQLKPGEEARQSKRQLQQAKTKHESDAEANAVLEATVQGLTGELERSIVAFEELRVQVRCQSAHCMLRNRTKNSVMVF